MSKVEELPKYGNYIDGAIVPPASNEYLPTENPYTGKVWALIGRGGERDIAAAVAAAERALTQGEWPRMSATQRGHLLWRLGDLIIANVDRLAAIEQRDNGKILSEACAQIRYMGDYFKYYGGLADKVQGAVIPTDKRGVFTYTKYEPKGVIGIITPWNSPLTLTSWKLAPALAAGCTAVIKPSEFTSASMLEFAPLFAEAGFPKGVVNVVTGLGTRGRRGARRASLGRAYRLHRRRCRGAQDLSARRSGTEDRHAGAWRQVAEHRLRRCRSRSGHQRCRVGDFRGVGPELPGGLAPPAATRASTTSSWKS